MKTEACGIVCQRENPFLHGVKRCVWKHAVLIMRYCLFDSHSAAAYSASRHRAFPYIHAQCMIFSSVCLHRKVANTQQTQFWLKTKKRLSSVRRKLQSWSTTCWTMTTLHTIHHLHLLTHKAEQLSWDSIALERRAVAEDRTKVKEEGDNRNGNLCVQTLTKFCLAAYHWW